MPGALKYIVDETGQKTSVLVPVKVWEDLNANYQKLQNKLNVFTSIQEGLKEVQAAKKNWQKAANPDRLFTVRVRVLVTKSFKAAVKPLLKKYPSLSGDLLKLEKELSENPKQGTSLGHGAYKIRLKISSKGKGKSGGARVISLVESVLIGEVQQTEEEIP